MNTVHLNNSEVVIIHEPQYMRVLNTILAETPKRVLANFQMWHTIRPLISILNEGINITKYRIPNERALNEDSRSSYCILDIKEKLPALLGSMYVRKYADPQSKLIAEQMADLLIAEFKKTLEGIDWMDDATKSVALKKVKAMKKRISYSEDLLDDKKIAENFKELHLEEDNFLYANINITRFYNFLEYTDLRKEVDDNDWFEFLDAADIMGGYDPHENSLVCAAGLLHNEANFFNKNQPMYMNFGRLGSQLAQEMTKDFYSIRQHFGGYFQKWWSNETEQAFLAKGKCIKDQFDQIAKDNHLEDYVDKPEHYANIITAIAGHRQSYHAYQKWLIQNDIDEYRPNLGYSKEQYYWINAGQLFCNFNPNPLTNTFYKFHIAATFGNAEEFSKDWKCPLGFKMNPVKKCTI